MVGRELRHPPELFSFWRVLNAQNMCSYDAVKQELAARFALIEEAEQAKPGTQLAQEVALFMHERHKTLQ
jgi:hypothetical protein